MWRECDCVVVCLIDFIYLLRSLLDPAILYTEIVCVSRLKLSPFVEPFLVGLVDVMIDFPFDVMGIKLIWWTWHESDPNIYDRTYFVPWSR